MSDRAHKLTRRQFAGAVALAAATPALGQAAASLPAVQQQEEKKVETPPADDFRAQALRALRAFELPTETEPAFVFQAAVRPK